MTDELWRQTATTLASMIRAKEVSSREVVESHLARIDAVNSQVNAITVVLADSALELAATADEATAAGEDLGPLHGVPMTIKENIDLAGSPTTSGVAALAEAVPLKDAPSIGHLKNAGAIPIGRTNLPDLGLRWHTDNDLRGPTINPWDPRRTPGGSSGGDGVALALGMTPLGNGNDLGGSLRVPSLCNGTAAIRPTLGRVASASDLREGGSPMSFQLMAVQGPMARSVEDLRLALEVASQPDPRDPWWTPAPLRGPAPDGPIRVAVTDAGSTDADVQAAVGSAARALSEAGYELEEVDPPSLTELVEHWRRLVWTEIEHGFLSVMEPIASKDALRFLSLWSQISETGDRDTYIDDLTRRNAIAAEWSLFLDTYPLVLGPVCSVQPFKVGDDLAGTAEVTAIMDGFGLTVAVNDLGLPAVALPTGTAEVDGRDFPQGVQVIATRYREDLCLDAAQAIEARLGALTPIDPRP